MFCSLVNTLCQPPKKKHLKVEKCSVPVNFLHLTLKTWKCASRHNGVHFFDISTSKSAPTLVWLVHFDFQRCFAPQRRALFRHLNVQKCSDAGMVAHFDFQMCFQMCFAPQRRALFQHLNVQKWSDVGVLCTFWLGNVLRAATACAFSISQLPKVLRCWCGLYILTSKCASHRNGVHFFHISTSESAPTLVWFVLFDFQMCFAPQRRAIFPHLNVQKYSKHDVVCNGLYILTSKCALHRNSVHFFHISTSKSAPTLVWFAHFGFQMCFAPQCCAIFRHLNVQKCSEHGVVCTV